MRFFFFGKFGKNVGWHPLTRNPGSALFSNVMKPKIDIIVLHHGTDGTNETLNSLVLQKQSPSLKSQRENLFYKNNLLFCPWKRSCEWEHCCCLSSCVCTVSCNDVFITRNIMWRTKWKEVSRQKKLGIIDANCKVQEKVKRDILLW